MAHDVWLIRQTLITCLLLRVVAGIAKGANKTLSTDQVSLSDNKDPASKAFPSHPHHEAHHLIKKGLSKVEHKLKQRISGNVHKKSPSTGKFHHNLTSTGKFYHKSTRTGKFHHTRQFNRKSRSARQFHRKSTRARKVHKKSTRFHAHRRLKNTKLKQSHENRVTKRTEVERSEETGAKRTRVQVLDSFFDHPETLKETPAQESSLARSREMFQSALSLDGLYSLQNEESKLRTTYFDGEVPAHFLDWSKKGFLNDELRTHENEVEGLSEQPESLYAKKYGKKSMEGKKIVNAASLVESSIESQGTGLTESVKYSEEKVGNRARAFQYFLPTNSARSTKRRSRYRYINSLIKPQLAGISADLNGLDAQRNRTKSVDLKALKNDFKSRELKLENQFNEAQVRANLTEDKNSVDIETKEESKHNTKQETEPQYHANDMFMLGTPDRSTYVQDLFLANPHPIKHFSGSGDEKVAHSKYKQQSIYAMVRPTLRWQKLTATHVTTANQSRISKVALEIHRKSGFQESIQSTKKLKPHIRLLSYKERTAANQDKALNKVFEKFRGSGFQESNSGEVWDWNDSGLHPDLKVDDDLQLIHQTDEKFKPTLRVSLQSFKDKSMSHIEEQSKQGSGVFYSSGHGSSDTQKATPSSYYRPTRVHGSPKVTTVSSYKRTTISHREFNYGYNSDYQSWTSSSGEESGSGEDGAFLLKHYHQLKLTPTSLPKNHTGILGVTDKETKTKCEKMGKSDYREKCPHGWLSFEQFCYLFVPHSEGKWEEFPQKCNEENALLAMPKTDKELAFLQASTSSSKSKTNYFYIGLKKKSETWTWIDDMPYTRDLNMTDKLGTNNCGTLIKGGDIHMISCNMPKAGYICELRTGVKALSILALGDSLTNGFHNEDKSRHTPYAKTLEFLLNKDVHRCYTLTTVAIDGVEASELSQPLESHLKNAKSKYSWVVILAGTNDILHNSHARNRKAWNTAVQHIIDLHIKSHRFGAKTMAVTIPEMDCEESDKPPCQHTRLERQYINEKLRHYARTNDFTILCDLATKFPRYSLRSVEREQLWEEGLHMKPAGYDKMAEIIYKDLLVHVDDQDSLK